MILLDAAVPPPDQIAALIQALGAGGPSVVLLGLYLFFTWKKDKGEGAGTEAALETINQLRQENGDLKSRLAAIESFLAEQKATEQRKAEREADRKAMREDLARELEARGTGPNSRVTGDFGPPTEPGKHR